MIGNLGWSSSRYRYRGRIGHPLYFGWSRGLYVFIREKEKEELKKVYEMIYEMIKDAEEILDSNEFIWTFYGTHSVWNENGRKNFFFMIS